MKTHSIKKVCYRMLFIAILCISGTGHAAEDNSDVPIEDTQAESGQGEEGVQSTPSTEESQGSSGGQGAPEGDPPPARSGDDTASDDIYEPKDTRPKEEPASAKTITVANTGAASYSYPLNLPPARGDAVPELSINYNSQSRSQGVLGFGFGLGIPSIQRMTKRGLDYDKDDYVANGQELVSRWYTWGQSYYGAKFETAFTRYYIDKRDPPSGRPESWVATTREGIKYSFGSSENSRQDFDNGQKIFKWYVDRIEDTNRNIVEYEYFKDENTVYLETIRYSKHENQAGDVDKEPMYKVELEYKNSGDKSVSYETHYPTRKSKRLTRIKIFVGENDLVREYRFSYRVWSKPDVLIEYTAEPAENTFGPFYRICPVNTPMTAAAE